MARRMKQTEQRDDLCLENRQEFMPGRFVRYDDMFDSGRHLYRVEEKIAALFESGEAEQAIGLYEAKGDKKSVAALCDWTELSPRDCERQVRIEMSKKRWRHALAWLEVGMELEPTRDWHNEGSHGLASKITLITLLFS